ncbi:MAG: metallophosphoesterase [Acidimicrobiales bacterium]|nr:metallophosphoesterase [Acidimicrobiales bacterium]
MTHGANASAVATKLWIFAVEDQRAQITWRRLGPGRARFSIGPATWEVTCNGGPGALEVDGLEPGRRHELVVEIDGWGRPPLRRWFRTLDPPPGPELFRFATISDLHLGATRFGYFHTMRERPEPPEPHSIRATRQALTELRAWGAELVVIKGDITNDGRAEEWEFFANLVAASQLPYEVVPGNHDNRSPDRTRSAAQRLRWALTGGPIVQWLTDRTEGRPLRAQDGLSLVGIEPSPVRHLDIPGLRIVLADTTREGRHLGTLDSIRDEVCTRAAKAAGAGTPVFVAGHHYPMPLPIPHFWPPGVPPRQAQRFFAALHDANPAAFYTAGHTHRNRRYERCGVVVTEVGSPKDYPGVWAGYVVYEGGLRQVVRRVATTDILAWTDYTRLAALGAWGLWSPGTRQQRCFDVRW